MQEPVVGVCGACNVGVESECCRWQAFCTATGGRGVVGERGSDSKQASNSLSYTVSGCWGTRKGPAARPTTCRTTLGWPPWWNSGTKQPWRGAAEERVRCWRACITYPLRQRPAVAASTRAQGEGRGNKDRHRAAVVVDVCGAAVLRFCGSACGGRAHTNSIAGWSRRDGQWFARTVQVPMWSYFGAQQTCVPDYRR
jgi:hypothetical protein